MNQKHIHFCFQLLVGLIATTQVALAAVFAESVTVAGLTLHWDSIFLSAVMCTLSGVAALLRRIDRELRANEGKLTRPLLFVAQHLMGSWLAGALGFVLGQIGGLDAWKEIGLMLVLSYAGATGIEWAIEKIAPNLPADKLP